MDTYDWYGACAILTNYTSVSPFECPASSKVSWRNNQIKANYQILVVASLARWFQGVTWFIQGCVSFVVCMTVLPLVITLVTVCL
jgi:hypothetical protein